MKNVVSQRLGREEWSTAKPDAGALGGCRCQDPRIKKVMERQLIEELNSDICGFLSILGICTVLRTAPWLALGLWAGKWRISGSYRG